MNATTGKHITMLSIKTLIICKHLQVEDLSWFDIFVTQLTKMTTQKIRDSVESINTVWTPVCSQLQYAAGGYSRLPDSSGYGVSLCLS